jgi:hypothetical protein
MPYTSIVSYVVGPAAIVYYSKLVLLESEDGYISHNAFETWQYKSCSSDQEDIRRNRQSSCRMSVSDGTDILCSL